MQLLLTIIPSSNSTKNIDNWFFPRVKFSLKKPIFNRNPFGLALQLSYQHHKTFQRHQSRQKLPPPNLLHRTRQQVLHLWRGQIRLPKAPCQPNLHRLCREIRILRQLLRKSLIFEKRPFLLRNTRNHHPGQTNYILRPQTHRTTSQTRNGQDLQPKTPPERKNPIRNFSPKNGQKSPRIAYRRPQHLLPVHDPGPWGHELLHEREIQRSEVGSFEETEALQTRKNQREQLL